MREPTNMELYQEIDRLRDEVKKNNVQDNSYQEYVNSLTQLAIAQKSGAISPQLCVNLTVSIHLINKKHFSKWSQTQRKFAQDLLQEMKQVNKSLTKKDESTHE